MDQHIQRDLDTIEESLARLIQSEQAYIQEAASHLLTAGGKRLRPLLVLLSGCFGKDSRDKVKRVAVCLEFIHMATLVHDDVIDDAKTRRGFVTVKERWDNQVAMVVGDFIFARALHLLAHLNDPWVHQVLSRGMLHMCQGEILQQKDLFNTKVSVYGYLHRIKRKTALLIALSCQLGARVSGALKPVVQQLYLFGYFLGMAFQLTDDVLDFIGDESLLGKPVGNDLRQGSVTLPVIYVLQQPDSLQKQKVLSYLCSAGREERVEEILQIVKRSGGIEYSQYLATRYLDKAMRVLNTLPASNARDALETIAHLMVKRVH